MPNYDPLPPVVAISDILNHAAAFITLYILHAAGYPSVQTRARFSGLVGYGIAIEAVQYFLPARTASLSDVAVDTTALLFAITLHHLFTPLLPRPCTLRSH